MTPEELLTGVAEQRRRLIDTLATLGDEEWDTPSLCAGWRVRDVVGHLISILEIPVGRFTLNAIRARSFDRYADIVAREIGAESPANLLARYRAQVERRFRPPLVGPIAPLTDVVIHTRDVERPLDRPMNIDADVLRAVVAHVCGGRAVGFVPRRRTKGLRFVATDLEWSAGSGALVSGSGEAIALAVMGRTVALPELSGDGVARLRELLGG